MKPLAINILNKNSKSSFSILSEVNRPIKPVHVTKLAQSIDMMGCIRPVVIANISFITGISMKYIIDGQHLFHALLRNNMDIPYVVIDIIDQQDLVEKIAKLNTSSSSWTLTDYIKSWSSIKPDYKILNKHFTTYDLELTTLAAILSNCSIDVAGNGTASSHIKKGTFKITNEKDATVVLDYLTDVLKVIPRLDRFSNNYVCKEYVNFYRLNIDKYNHKTFITNLSKIKTQFKFITQEQNAIRDIFKTLI